MDHYTKPESHLGHHHSPNARSSWFRQTPHHHRPHKSSKSVPQSEVVQNKSSHPSNDFLRKVVSMILDQYNLVGEANLVANKNQKLIQFEQPAKLEEILDLKINQDGLSDKELLELCEKVIKYSVKTTHPHFYNQLYGGCDQYGIAGSWMSDALNTSQATYEISPVFTIIEKQIIEFCGSKCGWQKDQIDGIFSPGGSMSNFYGMIMARFHKFPESKKNGILSYNQMVAFCSDNAHYSMVKSAIWMGMGSDAIIKIKTDERGRMIPSELEKAIEEAKKEGKLPFCVVATAGTTVLSAFDPFRDIAKLCKKHGLWMHIDGALGATFLLSSKYRSLLDGVQEADSLAWNLHKLAGVPLQCSLFLTRHRNILRQCNSLKAEYLFQNDKYYDAEYDSGDKSIQCGRKVDSLKAWLTLCSRGEREWEHLVDNLIHMNRYITDKLRNKPGFKLVLPHSEGSTVSFWYIPESMRNEHPLDPHKLHKVCPIIKSRMMGTGRLMINYNPLTCKNLPNFFRLSLTCIPPPTMEDMDFIIDEIDRLGKDITID